MIFIRSIYHNIYFIIKVHKKKIKKSYNKCMSKFNIILSISLSLYQHLHLYNNNPNIFLLFFFIFSFFLKLFSFHFLEFKINLYLKKKFL